MVNNYPVKNCLALSLHCFRFAFVPYCLYSFQSIPIFSGKSGMSPPTLILTISSPR